MQEPCVRVLIAMAFALHPSADALALDIADVGVYQVLNVENRPTERVIRLVGQPTDWRIEDRKSDGSWQDVTCEGGGKLEVSSERDQRRFFQHEDVPAVSMDCVHNNAFAFCSYTLKAVPTDRAYLFVDLAGPQPSPRRLRREP